MAELKVPIISTVIGEGGSGGALAIAVADQLLMLQYSTYSVISPEGCASILWKSADKASVAADAMGITAPRLKALDLIDRIVDEPVGGAHRNHAAMAQTLKLALQDALRQVGCLAPGGRPGAGRTGREPAQAVDELWQVQGQGRLTRY